MIHSAFAVADGDMGGLTGAVTAATVAVVVSVVPCADPEREPSWRTTGSAGEKQYVK